MKMIYKTAAVLMIMAGAAVAGRLSGAEESRPAAISEQRITAKTEIIAATEFSLCSHSIYEETDKYVGMDEGEFREAFGGRVLEFSPECVRAKRIVQEYCPKHLILIAEDGQLKIKRTGPDGRQQTVRLTGVFLKSLSESGKKRAEEGVVLLSMSELEEAVERLRN